MKKYRFLYGGVLLITAVLLFISTNAYLFGLMMVEILIPIVLYVLLRIETMTITTDLSAPHGCTAGESCPMFFEFHGKTPLAAAGMIRVVLEFKNKLYGRSVTEELKIPSAYKKIRYEVAFQAMVCGEEEIICKEIVFYDILGLTSIRVSPLTARRMMVSPRPVPVQLLPGTVSSNRREGEQFDYRKRGNDTSEVFDLREYQPGDDVRSIHWKLSSKFDDLIVKESGYSAHFDTIVLFDGGIKTGKAICDETVISGAMDFATTFSRKLLEMQRPHYIALLLQDTFVQKEVGSFDSFIQIVQQNMGIGLPEQTGGVLAHFMVRHMERDFSKILYIVNGEFPEEIYRLAEEVDVTGICITDKDDEIKTVEKGQGTLIEIPLKHLYDETHYIFV